MEDKFNHYFCDFLNLFSMRYSVKHVVSYTKISKDHFLRRGFYIVKKLNEYENDAISFILKILRIRKICSNFFHIAILLLISKCRS